MSSESAHGPTPPDPGNKPDESTSAFDKLVRETAEAEQRKREYETARRDRLQKHTRQLAEFRAVWAEAWSRLLAGIERKDFTSAADALVEVGQLINQLGEDHPAEDRPPITSWLRDCSAVKRFEAIIEHDRWLDPTGLCSAAALLLIAVRSASADALALRLRTASESRGLARGFGWLPFYRDQLFPLPDTVCDRILSIINPGAPPSNGIQHDADQVELYLSEKWPSDSTPAKEGEFTAMGDWLAAVAAGAQSTGQAETANDPPVPQNPATSRLLRIGPQESDRERCLARLQAEFQVLVEREQELRVQWLTACQRVHAAADTDQLDQLTPALLAVARICQELDNYCPRGIGRLPEFTISARLARGPESSRLGPWIATGMLAAALEHLPNDVAGLAEVLNQLGNILRPGVRWLPCLLDWVVDGLWESQLPPQRPTDPEVGDLETQQFAVNASPYPYRNGSMWAWPGAHDEPQPAPKKWQLLDNDPITIWRHPHGWESEELYQWGGEFLLRRAFTPSAGFTDPPQHRPVTAGEAARWAFDRGLAIPSQEAARAATPTSTPPVGNESTEDADQAKRLGHPVSPPAMTLSGEGSTVGVPQAAPLTEAEQEMVTAMQRIGKPASALQVANEAGVSADSVRQTARSLKRKGVVSHRRQVGYWLVEWGPTHRKPR